MNQGNSKALGSGLGYLEHICQLIEKIGQLQEYNLRLQKQVCSLQKEQKMSQIKEVRRLQNPPFNYILKAQMESSKSV